MSNIHKKLLAFAILLVAARANAQVPGSAPVQNKQVVVRTVLPHSVEWYRADLQKRFPDMKAPVTNRSALAAPRPMPGKLNPALIRQNLLARYPPLQQTRSIAPRQPLSASHSVLPGGRTMAFYREQALKQLALAQKRDEELRKQPLPSTHPIQQPGNHLQQPAMQNQPPQVQQPAATTIQINPAPMQQAAQPQRRAPITRRAGNQ